MIDIEAASIEILYLISMLGNWVGVIALLLIGVALLLIAREMKIGNRKTLEAKNNK